MYVNKNEISTLFSILSVKYPTQYPTKESIDELDSFLPAINFPVYSPSEIDSFSSIFTTKNTFKEIVECIHYYFPFVPAILQIISNYKHDPTEEILNICASIVMCSYVSWRAFCEYTQNFEHLQYLLNCIPFTSKSKYADIIKNIYCDALNYYLNECSTFNFNSIFTSMSLLLEKESINILSNMQSIFYTILSTKFLTQPNSEIINECQIFINYLCRLTGTFPDIFDSQISKEIITLLTNQIENIEINSLHLFANLYHKIEKEFTIPIFSIFPISYYKYIISVQQPLILPEEHNDQISIQFPPIEFPFDTKKVTTQEEECQPFSLIEGTFSEGLSKSPTFSIKNKKSVESILNEETREILTYIAQAAQHDEECRDIILKDFNSIIVQRENKYHSVLLYSLIYAVSKLDLSSKQSKAYWDILLASEIFNANYSIFEYKEADHIISQIRDEAIDSMILSGYKGLNSFLLNLSKYPFFLAEIFHRLHSNAGHISNHELKSADFLSFLVNSFLYFQKLNVNEKDQRKLRIIESTRICLLRLISQGLSVSDVAIFWFSIPSFSAFFSSLILENSIRCFIIDEYKLYLTKYFHHDDQVFIDSLKKFFEKLLMKETNSIPYQKSLSILIEFVDMVNSVLPLKMESIELFHELIDIIAGCLVAIDFGYEESHLFFSQVLRCFSFIKLNDRHYSTLEETTKKLSNEKHLQKMKDDLFRLASGNDFYKNSDVFPLQQPRVVTIVLANMARSGIEKFVSYLESEVHPLLKKSVYNCYQAFNFGIESFLIEKLKELLDEGQMNIILSNKILNVLTTIYAVKGSMRSAQQFIDFFGPIDARHVSALSPYFLQVLTTLFSYYPKAPNSYLSFCSRIDILNVDSSTFSKSFEISMWCLIEPFQLKSSKVQVCSILDTKGKGIVVSFSEDQIIVNHSKKHDETLMFDATFPVKKWHLVRIKFFFDQPPCFSNHSSQSSVDTTGSIRSTPNNSFGRSKYGSKSFNTSDYTPLSMFNTQPLSRSPIMPQLTSNQSFSPLKKNPLSFNFSFSTSLSNLSDFNSNVLNSGFIQKLKQSNLKYLATVSVEVDGVKSEVKELNLRMFSDQTVTIKIGYDSEVIPKGYFSCFSIFPLNSQDDNFFNWDNNECQIVSSNKPLLTLNFDKDNNHDIRPICRQNEAVITNRPFDGTFSSLADVFIDEMKIHSLILLFAEFDFLTFEQVKVPAVADFTIEMICAYIRCGKSAQISFYENKCTEAISHHLLLCDASHLNFSIYLQFVSLLSVISVPKLKRKLLKMIVLNFDIWGRSEPDVFRLITQHWSQTLFSDYKEKIQNFTSLPTILYELKNYSENEKILNNIINLYVKIADINLTSQNFLNMIEYCTIHKEKVKLVISYLELLKRTLSSRKESDAVISQSIQFISLLHNLIELNDETVFCSIIEIIMICHRKNFIKSKSFSLPQHMNIIMNKVTVSICTMSTLKMIVNLSNSSNLQLYPLCCLVALNQGKEAIEYLSQSIKPSKYLVSSFDRLFWLVLLLISIEDFERQKSFCILFNQSCSKIKEVCILILIISMACNKRADQHLNAFLNLEFTLISEHPESFQADFVHKILKIAYKSLMFQSKTVVDDWIQKVFENSPFRDQTDPLKKVTTSSNTANKEKEGSFLKREEIYRKIEEISNFKQKVVLRLSPKLDENGNWLESALAFKCIRLFEIYFKSSLLTYDLILCSFVFKFNPQLALTHLQRINISNYASKIQSNLLSFIFYSGENKGIDLNTILQSKQTFTKFGAFSFLQEFSDQIKSDFFGSSVVKMASDIFSLYDQSTKIERNFATFSDNAVKRMKEECSVVIDQIRTQKLILRFNLLHVWQQMWNEMSRCKGKWSRARNAAMVKNHFKRSARMIFNDHSNSYYPLKMKLNNEFYNDHIEASIARDIGSVKEAADRSNKKKSHGIVFSTLRPSISNTSSNYYEHVSKSSLFYDKYMNANPAFSKEAILISPKGTKKGYFEVFFDGFVINKKTILFSEISEIFLRMRFHRQTAFEIFKKNGKSYFIEIPNYSNTNLMKYFLPFMSTTTLSEYTEKWVNYEISTFEYLLKLNEFSSRTFNDLSAYPVMPWVIADYQSDRLDLDDPKTFRDLSKPMGAINEDRLNKLKSNSTNKGESMSAHLYPNSYISPLIVLSYLVRVEPFTTIHINYHGGKFEQNTKIFKSIPLAYKNATTLDTNFMELIPEFFTSSEFLLNKENFDLTQPESKNDSNTNVEIQSSSIIPDCSQPTEQISSESQNSTTNNNNTNKSRCTGHVQLPKWAMHASSVFIYMNRKALESNYVSMNIHKWIDLVFGYKQSGPEAEKADNTFNPLMYSDVWSRLERKEFSLKPNEVESKLSEVGQIPIQLFNTPHPQRQPASVKSARLYNAQGILNNGETIMLGINEIIFSSFQTVKTDETVITSSAASSISSTANKVAVKSTQKAQRQRDISVSGIVVDSSSKLICLTIKGKSVSTVFNDSIEKRTTFISSTEYEKLRTFGQLISPTCFVCCSNDFHSVFVFKPSEKVCLNSGRVNYSISHICFDGEFVITCGGNLMSVWSFTDLSKPLFTLPTYRNKINCIGLSSKFDLFVAGTLDGYVQFNSIDERRNIQITEIGDVVPSIVKITPAWGFVLVYGFMRTINSNSNFLILFSSNGHKIRQLEIPHGEVLTAIDVYKSKDGFDFAFVATESGNLYHFEVFFTKFDKPFYKAPFYINSISYILEQNMLYCTGKDNSILVVPYNAQ